MYGGQPKRHFKDLLKFFRLRSRCYLAESIKQANECSGRLDELTRFFFMRHDHHDAIEEAL